MTQEEFSAQNAQINADYRKKQLGLQQALQARKDQLQDLTKRYLEEKGHIEKAIQQLRVDAAEATAEASSRKADLTNRYLESLRADDQD